MSILNLDFGQNFRKISVLVKNKIGSRFWSKLSKNLDLGQNFFYKNLDLGQNFRKSRFSSKVSKKKKTITLNILEKSLILPNLRKISIFF